MSAVAKEPIVTVNKIKIITQKILLREMTSTMFCTGEYRTRLVILKKFGAPNSFCIASQDKKIFLLFNNFRI
jgi:hypothetical protein